jgi:hypothetical protein
MPGVYDNSAVSCPPMSVVTLDEDSHWVFRLCNPSKDTPSKQVTLTFLGTQQAMAAVTFGAHGPIFFQLVCTVCTQTVCTACSHTCLHLHPPITHCLHCHGLLPGAVRVQRGCTFHKSLVSGYVCFLRMGPTHVAQVCLEPVLLLLGLQEWTSMPCRKLTF